MLFSLKNIQGTANVRTYNNAAALEETLRMMSNGEKLDVRFGTDKQDYPYAWIESAQTDGFKILINQDILNMLGNYLPNGIAENTVENPNDIEKDDGEDGKSFEHQMFEQLIIHDAKRMQRVPTFRDKPGYISAHFRYSWGKIFFRVERTPELEELIAEHLPKRK